MGGAASPNLISSMIDDQDGGDHFYGSIENGYRQELEKLALRRFSLCPSGGDPA